MPLADVEHPATRLVAVVHRELGSQRARRVAQRFTGSATPSVPFTRSWQTPLQVPGVAQNGLSLTPATNHEFTAAEAVLCREGSVGPLRISRRHQRAMASMSERSPEADIELSCVNVAEEHRRGVSKSTFPAME